MTSLFSASNPVANTTTIPKIMNTKPPFTNLNEIRFGLLPKIHEMIINVNKTIPYGKYSFISEIKFRKLKLTR